MFKSLKDFFDGLLPTPAAMAAADTSSHQLQIATAVLLVEVMRADTTLAASEREAVVAALQREFGLADDQLQPLLALAHERSRSATDFHAFTSALNDRFDDAQKLRIVEAMWQVAYADGHLEAHEQHVLWRVADLLHVPHGAYIGAKVRARDAREGRASRAGAPSAAPSRPASARTGDAPAASGDGPGSAGPAADGPPRGGSEL